jgi:hypothetical protein
MKENENNTLFTEESLGIWIILTHATVKLIGLNLFRNRKYFKTQEMMDIE